MLADFKNDRRLVEGMPDHDRESATEARPTRAIFFFSKKPPKNMALGFRDRDGGGEREQISTKLEPVRTMKNYRCINPATIPATSESIALA